MRTTLRSTVALGIGLLLFPIATSGQHHGTPGVPPGRARATGPSRSAQDGGGGKRSDMVLTRPTRVAGSVLEPGRYTIGMQADGASHVLVVQARDERRGGRDRVAVGSGAEVARVPCELVDTDRKVSSTTIRLRPEADGTQTLTGIAIKGEHAEHLVAAPPSM